MSALGVRALELTPIGTYATGIFDEGAAEIVAHDPDTQRVFVINADASVVDVLDISDPENPVLAFSIDVTDDIDPNGGLNSVDVKNGVVAVAVENDDPAMNGIVAFYDADGNFIGSETVGVLPDAVKFSDDGQLLVVADEGEPVEDDDGNLIADPIGSVSVIDISGGVASAVVTTLDFTAFDPMKAALSAKGIKLQDGVPVSQDLEPEFPAISKDNTQAFVTLQEANAFAVIDLTVPAVIDILPIGYKDHSKGQPELDTFSFRNPGLLGTDANGLKIKLGGFSGLWYEGSSRNKLEFITVGDRGPNGSEVVAGTRTFNLPDYQARVVSFEVNTRSGRGSHNSKSFFDRGRNGRNGRNNNGSAVIKDRETVYLTREDGVTPITGLPNIPGFDEIPVDAAGNPLNYDPYGADIEGIVRDPVDGSLWMVDEYRPAIYHFDEDGTLIARLVPENTHMLGDSAMKEAEYGTDGNSEGFYGLENLPEVYNKRRPNRGFEGLALDPDKRVLYAFIQSPMDNPDTSTRNSSVLRILAVDVDESSADYLTPAAEYV